MHAEYFFLFYSFHGSDQDEVCSNWVLLNLFDIGIPLLWFVPVVGIILKCNGKDLYREIWFPLLSSVANPPFYHVNA